MKNLSVSYKKIFTNFDLGSKNNHFANTTRETKQNFWRLNSYRTIRLRNQSVLEKLFSYPYGYKISKKDFLESLNELFHAGYSNESFVLALRSLFEDNFNLTLYSWKHLYSWENLLPAENRIKFILYSDDFEIFLFLDIKEN